MRFVDGIPVPVPTPTSQPFWDGLRERKIVIQYSPSSEQWVFYPRVNAPGTLANDLEWREISGRATLYTYTLTSRPTGAPWTNKQPQCLAIIELAEGPRMTTELVNVADAVLRIGMDVEPVFEDIPGADITMLRYQPAEGAAPSSFAGVHKR